MNEFTIGNTLVPPGTTCNVRIKISETYTGDSIAIPVRVARAREPGPTVFVVAGIHGDEMNGIGIIHRLMYEEPLELIAGTLLLIPVVNVFGFEASSRYLPDRRDLNRSFPGSATGSMASRVAHIVMKEIVSKCDYGIDLHTASIQRTNFPNVRGDLANAGVRRLANAFGCELIVNGKGPVGSLRRAACRIGCPTVLLEAGEPWKIEPSILKVGVRGIRNVLIDLGMMAGEPLPPIYQARVAKTIWVRAQVGGILNFHVIPGDFVSKGDRIATNYSIMGEQQNILVSPIDGIVLGMATIPAVKPGEPVCQIARPTRKLASIRAAITALPPSSLYHSVKRDLATNITVTDGDDPRVTPTM